MAPSMPAMDRGLKDMPNDACVEAWRAVLTHPINHQQPFRNSFCCGAAVAPYCAGSDMMNISSWCASLSRPDMALPSKHQHTAVHLVTANCM
jgi:hypothetical protein